MSLGPLSGATGVAILDALPDSILLVDSQQKIIAANRAAARMLGDNPVGRPLALALRQPDILAAVDAVLGGAAYHRTTAVIHAAVRQAFDVHAAALPPDAPGDARVVVSLRDITAQDHARKTLTEFVANASHELRSPLASLTGFIETLRTTARDDTAARDRFLTTMGREASRMSRLVSDLLSLSRIEAREHVAPREAVDIDILLNDVARISGARAGVTIPVAVEASLPQAVADPDELTQVFDNLVDNAHTHAGKEARIRISARALDRIPEAGGSGIAVEVSDSGRGMAPEHLPRLTERFYRIDRGRSRTEGGAGLGLAIVKHIVNRHRGHLAIRSTPGEGSVFTVFLPTASAENAPDETAG